MRKLMIVQLGLLLALASSNALAVTEAAKGKDVRDGVTDVHEDAATRRARGATQDASANALGDIKTQNTEDVAAQAPKKDVAHLPPKGKRTPEQQAEAANIKILTLAESGALGKENSQYCKAVLTEGFGGYKTEDAKLDAIAGKIKKGKGDLLAKCEE